MKTALITGGAGFLGSHLCDLLLERGYKVIAMDNFITGHRRNIAHLGRNPDFRFIEQDVSVAMHVDEDIDYILHFASPASPIDYQQVPIETLMVGSMGTRNALELAKEKNARLLLASTSEVYGDPEINPQVENYWGNVNPIGVRSCYDEAKRFAEAITMAYRRKHGVDTRIVRIFNTYGPRMRANDGRVVPAFITQALNNEPITVFGEGRQTRSFCYYSDLIEGIYRLLLSDELLPTNIGNPTEMTILEFAQEVIGLTGSKSRIIHKELPKDDPQLRRPDITKAKRVLQWEPKVPLHEGLKHTIDYFRDLK